VTGRLTEVRVTRMHRFLGATIVATDAHNKREEEEDCWRELAAERKGHGIAAASAPAAARRGGVLADAGEERAYWARMKGAAVEDGTVQAAALRGEEAAAAAVVVGGGERSRSRSRSRRRHHLHRSRERERSRSRERGNEKHRHRHRHHRDRGKDGEEGASGREG